MIPPAALNKTHTMPKILTYIGLGSAALIALVFLLDLAIGVPFKRASVLMDVVFIICAVALAFMSWTTMKEQL